MKIIDQILDNERTHAGWRFWLMFVIMTNVGLFPRLGLERVLFGEPMFTLSPLFRVSSKRGR